MRRPFGSAARRLGLVLVIAAPLLSAQAPTPLATDPLRDVSDLLDEALRSLNLARAELGFPKEAFVRHLTAVNQELLGSPLGLPRRMDVGRRAAWTFARSPGLTKALRVVLELQGQAVFPQLPRHAQEARTAAEGLERAVGREVVGASGLVIAGAGGEGFRKVFVAVAALEDAVARSGLRTAAADEARRELIRSITGSGARVSATRIAALDGADRDALLAAVLAATQLLDEAIPLLATIPAEVLGKPASVAGVDGDVRLYLETPRGPVIVGGPGPTRYRCAPYVVIDLGGDDDYSGEIAATADARPVAIAIDLAGDDRYTSAGPGQGAAFGGVAILCDAGDGADSYTGGDLCQGAALGGVGLLFDGGGRDLYRAGRFAQGAATCGYAVLADAGGDDQRLAGGRAQGFGGVRGAAALLDVAGDDVAILHGEEGQGCGAGERSAAAAGGIGFLWDGDGDDVYTARRRAQGFGDWFGCGLHVDDAGRDRRDLGGEGQGHGRRLGIGGLWDLRGDDRYGLAEGSGQGAAVDLAVGLLLDGSGDDIYSGLQLSQGAADWNAVGLLIDAAGDDVYVAGPAGGAHQGHGTARRSFGSVGLLLDVAGRDALLADGAERRVRGQWGLAWDVGAGTARAADAAAVGARAEAPLPAAEPATYRRLLDLATAEPGRAQATLVALGVPAARWLLEHQLGATEPARRALVLAVLRITADPLRQELRTSLADADPWRRRAALELVAHFKDRGARTDVRAILGRDPEPALRRRAALVLGALGDSDAMPELDRLVKSEDLRDRRAAAQALAGIPGEQAAHRLADLLADVSFAVRDPAREALRGRRETALAVGLAEIARVDGRARIEWLRLFEAWRPKEAAEAVRAIRDGRDPVAAEHARRVLEAIRSTDEEGRK